jgi:hypothetical protein
LIVTITPMLPFRDLYPELSLLPDDQLFDLIRPNDVQFRSTHPYAVIRRELDALMAIDDEISGYPEAPTYPTPIPSNTSLLYSTWAKKQSTKSAMNKAAICLAMRVPQAGSSTPSTLRQTFG